jgi:hypothetical protein
MFTGQQVVVTVDDANKRVGRRPVIPGGCFRHTRKVKTLHHVPVVQALTEVAFNRSREAMNASRRKFGPAVGQLQKPFHFGVPLSLGQARAFQISSSERSA